MKKKIFTSVGLMSGTSMDGVDLSIIRSDGQIEFSTVLDDYFEFDQVLRKNLINLRNKILVGKDIEKYSNEINQVERDFTIFNSKVINKILKVYNDKVDIIGFHGQTIFHDSKSKISEQLGNGQLLSQLTKKIVVNKFRQKDLDNGGQGAPLTPIFHKLISQLIDKKYNLNFPISIINIGGITNITHIVNSDNISTNNVFAYDIAPGNCLIDEWVQKNSKDFFDKNGNVARSGNTNDLILNQALENFTITNFQSSLDIKNFDISFVKGLSFEDGCATLTEFSAKLIVNGIESINKQHNSFPELYLICGGGRRNSFLMDSIKKNLANKEVELKKIDDYEFNGDFTESQAFGYLSIRRYLNLPISFPNTTRCKNPTTGGNINKSF